MEVGPKDSWSVPDNSLRRSHFASESRYLKHCWTDLALRERTTRLLDRCPHATPASCSSGPHPDPRNLPNHPSAAHISEARRKKSVKPDAETHKRRCPRCHLRCEGFHPDLDLPLRMHCFQH